MQLLSINIGQKRTQQKGNELETTGIYKLPTPEPVQIGTLGIKDDFIASEKHHGGPDQAVYVYGAADYAWWSKELGKEPGPGTFGDNLTISDLESAQYKIGDRFEYRRGDPRSHCAAYSLRHVRSAHGRPAVCEKVPEGRTPGVVLPSDPGRNCSNRRGREPRAFCRRNRYGDRVVPRLLPDR